VSRDGDSVHRPGTAQPERLLDFRSGGWVLLLSGVLVVAVIVWRLTVILPTLQHRSSIDPHNIDSYGFDLSTLLVSRDVLVSGGFARDALPAMNAPAALPAAVAKDGEKWGGARKLISADRIIAVEVAGQARAYPLWILIWHEVVNDTLGGRPIAVTYSPLCDSAVVFERQVGDETLEFGVSGLLCNSNLVMFDRRPQREQESLWSQLQMRAIAGPAARARTRLRVLPSTIMPWPEWRAAHPEGTVLLPDPGRRDRYKKSDAYDTYFKEHGLRFPVAPLPPSDGQPPKTPIVALATADGDWRVLRIAEIVENSGAGGAWTTQVGGYAARFRTGGKPPTAWVQLDEPLPEGLKVVHSFWFAWYAAQAQ
jgi:hypothetical protein